MNATYRPHLVSRPEADPLGPPLGAQPVEAEEIVLDRQDLDG
jgi:hypothetical protein